MQRTNCEETAYRTASLMFRVGLFMFFRPLHYFFEWPQRPRCRTPEGERGQILPSHGSVIKDRAYLPDSSQQKNGRKPCQQRNHAMLIRDSYPRSDS